MRRVATFQFLEVRWDGAADVSSKERFMVLGVRISVNVYLDVGLFYTQKYQTQAFSLDWSNTLVCLITHLLIFVSV